MEQRLFIAACVMYAFTWLTRWLKRKEKINSRRAFAWWHTVFTVIILSCVWWVFAFIIGEGGLAPIPVWKNAPPVLLHWVWRCMVIKEPYRPILRANKK